MGNDNFGRHSEYEDIVSDSSFIKNSSDSIPLSEIGNKHYKKKSRGVKGWWSRLSRGKRATVISLTSVILILSLLISWFFIYWRYNYNPITENYEELGFEGKIDKNVINIALFGIDTRDKKVFKGNSDSIMILSLNTELKTVKIVSVMRDTIVPITVDGKTKYGKINSAYAKSPEIAIRTLNEIFHLDISEYATVNFFGMTEIIDAVGGIDITVTEDELKWKGHDHPNLNNCMDEICENLGLDANKYYVKSAGEQHVNGVQAVAYSRVRNCRSIWGTTDDYGRTDRQRYVMEQLFNKAITLEKSKYTKLAKALIPCTETSLSYSQILGLAFNVLLNKPTFYQARIPQDNWQIPFRYSGYGSVVYYDLEFSSKVLHALFYEGITVEEYLETGKVEKNDWFAKIGKTTVTPSSSVESTVSDSSNKEPSVTDNSSTDNSEPPIIDDNDNSSAEDTSSGENTEDGDNTEPDGNTENDLGGDTP